MSGPPFGANVGSERVERSCSKDARFHCHCGSAVPGEVLRGTWSVLRNGSVSESCQPGQDGRRFVETRRGPVCCHSSKVRCSSPGGVRVCPAQLRHQRHRRPPAWALLLRASRSKRSFEASDTDQPAACSASPGCVQGRSLECGAGQRAARGRGVWGRGCRGWEVKPKGMRAPAHPLSSSLPFARAFCPHPYFSPSPQPPPPNTPRTRHPPATTRIEVRGRTWRHCSP